MRYILLFIDWVISTSYHFSVIKRKNLIDNSIFFTSIIFTDIIGLIINLFVYFFDLNRPKPYLYLITLIIVFASNKIYLSDKTRLNHIMKKNVNKNDFTMLFLVFFILQILFFSSLALIY
ncbi:hypothetical protein FLCU109888_03120 [Flavobacterium cucumis]|uniref:Uncharacterized protein n=1 Tax=Flavobacterium cucumis TaxID=416016 RepID=A0A1M7ZUQ7_9FLAO|nr:hypothetical protein SAMN05443547_0920 [Flavobacterium cucumis]